MRIQVAGHDMITKGGWKSLDDVQRTTSVLHETWKIMSAWYLGRKLLEQERYLTKHQTRIFFNS